MSCRKIHLKTNYLLILPTIGLACFLLACQNKQSARKQLLKVTTFAGLNERFGEPFGVAVRSNEIYVSDGEKGVIWKVSKTGAMQVFSDKLDTPSQIAFDESGDLIVADSGTHTIKKINPAGEIETLAGVENQSGYADGDAQSALFNAPIGVAAYGNKIYVADTYNDVIRVIENGQVSTLAGSVQGFADGLSGSAKFDTPCGIAVTKDGIIIVADTGNKRLRLIEQTGATSTLAGNGNEDLKDGLLFDAGFVQPSAVSIGDSGEIFVADGNAIRVIRKQILPFVETLSDERRGFADGVLRESRFNRPSGLAIDETGNLYVADSENQALRVFTGDNLGAEITEEDKNNLRFSAEEFRRLAAPRWTYNPPEARRDIAGTLGEIRGEINGEDKPVWFHNGLDIAGGYGETARFVRDEKVLLPVAAEGFENLRERLRMPTIGYIHIRLGRDKDNVIYNDRRFLFSRSETGKLNGIRVPRGAKFAAGEAIGTLNSFNHVHLIAGRSGAEMNALDALIFPNISDRTAPIVEKLLLYDENWQPLETSDANRRISLSGKTRIVVRAYDQMDGSNSRRRLGVYRLGYQVLREDKTTLSEPKWTISFDRMPDEHAVEFVYARGSQSGYTPETVFNYIVSNVVNGNDFREDFFDAGSLEKGVYILRVFAADFFGNTSSKDFNFEVIK